MNTFNLATQLAATRHLAINETTTGDDAGNAMNMLTTFNQCHIGLTSFSGQTPWEWHPDDEMLLVLDGEVSLEVLPIDGPAHQINITAGQLCTVPARHWHRQHARERARLLFLTSQEGNDASELADPRNG